MTASAPTPGRLLLREPVPPALEPLLRAGDERADRWFDGRKAPGLVYGVVHDGRLVHARGLGTLRVGEDAPPDLESAFRIASMTKSFSAATVLLLRDEGRLALDDPAEQYVPELAALRYPTADSPRITIRHLLTMTAGFPTDDPWGDRQQGLDLEAFSELLRGGLSFAWVPGIQFEYSNLGYGILGRVITRAAGQEYREVVRARLLEPLGMTSTGFLAEEVAPERLAHGYVWRDGAFVEEPIDGYGAFASMGGIFTTIVDLSRWVAGFLDAWPPRDGPDDGHPLPRAVRREMQQPLVPVVMRRTETSTDATSDVEVGGYGFGLFTLDTFRTGRSVGHGGGYPGFGSHMRWHPATGLGVVGLANGRYAPVTLLVREILAELVASGAVPVRRPSPAPATARAQAAVMRLLERWDESEARALFAMNVELDEPLERRRGTLEALATTHGALRPDDELPSHADNAFHLEWWLAGERGRVKLEILLSPELPPLVQALNVTSVPEPSPPLRAVAGEVLARLADPGRVDSPWPADPALGADVDRAALASAIRAAAARFAPLRLGPAIAGDGEASATFRLPSERGAVELAVERDPRAGAVTAIRLVPVAPIATHA